MHIHIYLYQCVSIFIGKSNIKRDKTVITRLSRDVGTVIGWRDIVAIKGTVRVSFARETARVYNQLRRVSDERSDHREHDRAD